jgi:hypothetical protein
MDLASVLHDKGRAFAGIPHQAALGRKQYLIAAPGDGLADDLLRPAQPVGRRGVNQSNAAVDGNSNCIHGIALIGVAPHPPANGPGSQADH